MTKLADAGIFVADSGKEDSDEEVLEVDKQDSEERGNTGADPGEDAVPQRHYRR